MTKAYKNCAKTAPKNPPAPISATFSKQWNSTPTPIPPTSEITRTVHLPVELSSDTIDPKIK